MTYKIKTNRGLAFTINQESFDPAKFLTELNNEHLLMIALGDIVMQKHNIESIAPERTGEITENSIDVHMGSGELLQAVEENFNSEQLAAEFNDNRNTFVLLGDTIVNRHSANMILPTPETV